MPGRMPHHQAHRPGRVVSVWIMNGWRPICPQPFVRQLGVVVSSPVSPKTGRLILSGRDVPLKQQERRNGPGSITNG